MIKANKNTYVYVYQFLIKKVNIWIIYICYKEMIIIVNNMTYIGSHYYIYI